MDKFHNQAFPYLIYAILWEDDGDKFAFVGKTTTTDTKALLRRHLRGAVKPTASALKQDNWVGDPPRLVVLHSLLCTGAEAYRYLLCYHRLYEDFGYMTLAYRRVDNYAYDMRPGTQRLYEELQKTVTMELLLTGINIPKPAISAKASTLPRREPMEQLNIRLDTRTLFAFQKYCNNLNITQREGFVHLMHFIDQEDLSTNPLFVEQKERIERQKKQIYELSQKLQSESRGQKADAKLKNAIANIKRLVTQYIALVVVTPTTPLLKDTSHKTYVELKEYVYPSSDGYALLELHDLRYSSKNHSAMFIYGKDMVNETAIKLRYYPKNTYIGYSPRSNYFARNAQFLVCYQHAEENVMELVAALPLPPCEESKNTEQFQSNRTIKSLDEKIQEASTQITYYE